MSDKFDRPANAAPKGGYIFSEEEVKEQRKEVTAFIKKIGMNIFEIGDIMRTSLPVGLFEPRSYLERAIDMFGFLPNFLPRAAKETNPLERMKLVMSMVVAGFHLTCTQKKPFNPILGETYQAVFPNGARVNCEQIAHHPAVTAWEIVGPNNEYYVHGRGPWVGSIRGNSVKGQQGGLQYVEFADGTVIEYGPLPEVWLGGILFGERVIEYIGKMPFHDKKNDLYCELSFSPDSGRFLKWIRGKQLPSDYIRGEITQGTAKDAKVLSEVEGSWLGGLDFDGKRYWHRPELTIEHRSWPMPIDDAVVMKSDSRFREDLIHLKANDKEQASIWKHKLEEIQRHDRKLRKEFHKKK